MGVLGLASEDFAGKVAVVTGGTDGLGKHLSKTLVDAGAEVYFCGRREEQGRALEKEWGGRAHYVRCDLMDLDQGRAFVREAGEARGYIDFLVNNAAMDPRRKLEDVTPEEFDNLLAVNLRSMFFVTQTARPYLEKGKGKAIVNLCTTNYMLGLTPFTLYNASKSGIVGFTRSLARELGPAGIRANTLSPGWIMTEKQLREHVAEQDKQELLEAQCLPFLLEDRHVTPAILFLLGQASCGISGQELVVDGGKVMH